MIYNRKKERHNWVCECPEGYIYSAEIAEGYFCKCKNPTAMSQENSRRMFELRQQGLSDRKIAKIMKVSAGTVSNIINSYPHENNI